MFNNICEACGCPSIGLQMMSSSVFVIVPKLISSIMGKVEKKTFGNVIFVTI